MAEETTRERRGGSEQPPFSQEGTASSTGGMGLKREAGTVGSGKIEAATRRQLLKTGVGLGAVGVAGYGYLRSQDEVVAATNGSTVDDVPNRAEFVFSWTGTELFRTGEFNTAVDQELRVLAVDEAGSTTELSETISASTAIEPRELGAITAFGEFPRESENYAGVIFESEAEPQTVRDRLDSHGSLHGTSEYKGQTLWVVGNDRLEWEMVLCHLGSGRYALGSNEELEDIIDVRTGEQRRVGGRVIDGLERTENGLLRGGFAVPIEAFASLDLSITTGLAESIDFGAAVIADGSLTVTLVAPNSSAATDLDRTLNALGQLDQDDIAAQIVGDSPVIEVVLALLADLTTEVNGTAVQVTVSNGYQVPAIVGSFLLERAVGR